MSSDASPHEIYSTIREVVRENYNYHREQVSRAYGLLELLSGHRPVADTDMEKAKQEYLESIHPDVPDDEPIVLQKKWIMPVEEVMDEDTYEINYAITFPQDLLDQTGWMEGDQLEWIDRDDGSFQLRKVNDD
jgi:hypothetical protein